VEGKVKSNFPDLSSNEEWCKIDKNCDLQPFDVITTLKSGRKYPTTSFYLKSVWKIELLHSSHADYEDLFVKSMTMKMRRKFKDY